jgi:hypothetical protein
MNTTEEVIMQKKLIKSEWESIEIPVTGKEQEILDMLSSIDDINKKIQRVYSMASILKLDATDEKFQYVIYNKYYKSIIDELDVNLVTIPANSKKIKLNSKDKIRFENNTSKKENSFELTLIKCIENILKSSYKNEKIKYKYALNKLLKQNIYGLNKYVHMACVNCLARQEESEDEMMICLENINNICNNPIFTLNADIGLYDHQKNLIKACDTPYPKIIFYKASTGTGKTLSPLGLLNKGHRVIFLCGARHVGLSLAKSAISCKRKIAFAYGCSGVEDIKLHNFAAKEYIKHRKTGGIFRINHEVGDDVELIISDLQSYRYAMLYMQNFNDLQKLIMFWDEPTISMDYENHPLHSIIKQNWRENIIPNIVLSSATLPKEEELTDMIISFKYKFGFDNSEIINIDGHDITKSIPVLNTEGLAFAPHLFAKTYDEFKEILCRCKENITLLRYINLSDIEIVFKYLKNRYNPYSSFNKIIDINIPSSKIYYLDILNTLNESEWLEIKNNCVQLPMIIPDPKYGINRITTVDANTLTNGPSIYLCKNSEKVAEVLLNELKIPSNVLDGIQTKINNNYKLTEHITRLEKEIEYAQTMKENDTNDGNGKTKLKTSTNRSITIMQDELDTYNSAIQITRLPEIYIPNSVLHKKYWTTTNNGFVSDIDDDTITKIMAINEVSNFYKLLLLAGIGVFGQSESCRNQKYTEIMKQLAIDKKLYLILADSDYIYGTNYSFSHGIIGKDMLDMTQNKIIQAMGRVGRMDNNTNTYTVRIRDNRFINKIFTNELNSTESRIMNELLNCSDI